MQNNGMRFSSALLDDAWVPGSLGPAPYRRTLLRGYCVNGEVG
jgi:hypothetical protein